MNEFHVANRRGWDAVSPGWQSMVDARVDWRRSAEDPHIAFDPRELEFLGEVSGREICVLGSGDNLAAFVLAGMGARVTSVDFSQVQLDIAAHRARELGLDIAFICSDVVNLESLADASFDLVYTGGHVAVWVSDLWSYYREACRILLPGGIFLVNEYHPFRRIWQAPSDRLEPANHYLDRGPHSYDRSDAVPGSLPGSLPSYEFHWTVADHVSAITEGGCDLVAMDEFGDQTEWWEQVPLAGLPRCLLLVGRRR